MEQHTRDLPEASPESLGARWFDPIEGAIRDRVRGFIEELVEAELDEGHRQLVERRNRWP